MTTARSVAQVDPHSHDAVPTAPPPAALFRRLRLSFSSKASFRKPPVPFRRRTESVSTVLSSTSLPESSASTSGKSETDPNALAWLEHECPSDVLPKILAFTGPQQVAALAKTNTSWRAIVHQEPLWRVLCEELYKWKPGDSEPESWLDYYRYSPCVPIDYPSIPSALAVAMEPPLRTRGRTAPPTSARSQQQIRSVRILLRPGTYYLRQALDIQARPGVVVSLETMELPPSLRMGPPLHRPAAPSAIMEQPLPTDRASERLESTKRRPSFRRLFSCRHPEPLEETDLEETDFTATADDWPAPTKTHATLVLRSRRHNEPVVRVRQGLVQLRHLELQHSSPGMDIWNGNAAVQIQPPLEEDPPVEPRPTAILQRTHVSSGTGRGIVNIDGGRVVLQQCAVTDCAATGVYIGGGSEALLQSTDVIRNGVGHRGRRGIARGHSGIYLEQGSARIQQSNVSSNTLTGISVVSPEQAFLVLEDSVLMNNGTYQLELPPLGTVSRQQTVTRNNTMAVRGEAPLRSGLNVLEPPPPPLELHHAPHHPPMLLLPMQF